MVVMPEAVLDPTAVAAEGVGKTAVAVEGNMTAAVEAGAAVVASTMVVGAEGVAAAEVEVAEVANHVAD